jgi:hypothetical protein
VTPLLLHLGHYWSILTPPESHRFFGAGFLFIGVLLVVEVVAGNVWFRSRLRTLIWPLIAMACGEGLIIVAVLDPIDRTVHFTTGLLVLAAGWLELRYRLGRTRRVSADLVVVPALLASGFEMGVVHARGTTFTTLGHMAMGMTAAMMAGARLYQGRRPSSFARNLATGFLVIGLALILLLLQP